MKKMISMIIIVISVQTLLERNENVNFFRIYTRIYTVCAHLSLRLFLFFFCFEENTMFFVLNWVLVAGTKEKRNKEILNNNNNYYIHSKICSF
jgi:hypothetical protein